MAKLGFRARLTHHTYVRIYSSVPALMAQHSELKVIRESTSDYHVIEDRIKDVFTRDLYHPLLKLVKQGKGNKLTSQSGSLMSAIHSGRVTFNRGTFSGRFNASISKDLEGLGAQWDRKTGTWKIPLSSLPIEVRNQVSASETKFLEKIEAIDRKLAQVLPEEVAGQIQLSQVLDKVLYKTERKFQASIKAITVSPTLTDSQRKQISEVWESNLKFYIRDLTEAQVLKLRKEVQESVFKGNRYGDLVSKIERSFDVTKNKAKFLARQETGQLLSKFKEVRYRSAGVEWYEWRCVHRPKDKTPSQHILGNVRYSHGILEGKKFRWSDPPVTSAPGEPTRRNNPGQDFNCRCFAVPLVGYHEEQK